MIWDDDFESPQKIALLLRRRWTRASSIRCCTDVALLRLQSLVARKLWHRRSDTHQTQRDEMDLVSHSFLIDIVLNFGGSNPLFYLLVSGWSWVAVNPSCCGYNKPEVGKPLS
jgi:hypothetical protein